MSESIASADTMTAAARTGQLLAGKYRLERLLGRGGMGEVYEARHAVVGRRFAVKFLHAAPAPGSSIAARFLREAQAAGALESPHIAAVLDFDLAPDGAPFLVMEYLAGETLSQLLRREKRLPLPRVAGILLQACAGLAVAHRAGIVHRDLKPENLFLVQRANGPDLVKIVDFGIAKLLGDPASADVTQSGAVLGTPYYMAPEQARGVRNIDQRVDVHALGVIGYELLSGRKPHPGDSYNAILAHILTEPVVPLGEACPGLPKRLCEVIHRAMAHDAADRYGTVEGFAKDLTEFAGREIELHGDAIDLRDRSAAETASNDLATKSDDAGATVDPPGTLGSVAGDVQAPSLERTGRRKAAVILAIAGAAAVLSWLPLPHGSTRNQSAVERTESSLVPARSVAFQAAEASAAAAPPAASTAQAAPATIASAALPRPAPQASSPRPALAPSSKKHATPAASGFTFDEQNPY